MAQPVDAHGVGGLLSSLARIRATTTATKRLALEVLSWFFAAPFFSAETSDTLRQRDRQL